MADIRDTVGPAVAQPEPGEQSLVSLVSRAWWPSGYVVKSDIRRLLAKSPVCLLSNMRGQFPFSNPQCARSGRG